MTPVPFDPARLARGEWANGKHSGEGDVSASYSADCIAQGTPVRRPFRWQGSLWICVGSQTRLNEATNVRTDEFAVYRLTPAQAFRDVTTTYGDKVFGAGDAGDSARADPLGFYHGMAVKHGGSTYVLTGPQVTLVPGEAGQSVLSERGEADSSRESRLKAERMSLELRQKSARKMDAGDRPITESPLFGGPAQGSLFE